MSKQFLLLLLLASQGLSQTPFIREGSIGQPASKSDADQDKFGTLEIKDWKGQKFIFLPESKKLQHYGYQGFNPPPTYDKWVGKILTVVDVNTKEILPEFTFKSSDGKTIRAKAYGDSIHGIAPLRDLEYAHSNWLGKTFWIADSRGLVTWDETTEQYGSVKAKKYSPLVVQDVVASWDDNSPIRIILKIAKGDIGFRDVNASGTNIGPTLRRYSRFADEFLEQDPRLTKNWPEEIWTAIEAGKVFIGMTSEQARMSWGEPKSVNRTATTHGTDEQWVYGSSTYLYIEAGKVTAVQN